MEKRKKWNTAQALTRTLRANMLLLFLFPVSLCLAQEPVAGVERWYATVDSASQHIVLGWSPSADSGTMGYHICSGTPCLDYDTVFGRLDTTYTCLDHSPLERHTYRLHVFDSAHNVSALTPPFGNMVLQADVPECETTVTLDWTPCTGMPFGTIRYSIQGWLEPFNSHFKEYSYTFDSNALHYTFEISEAITHARFRIEAQGEKGFRSHSNIVHVVRRTVDSASVIEINSVEYDSIETVIRLTFTLDPAFTYTLYRSIDGTPWAAQDTLRGRTTYTDRNINPFDSLHCYQLGVLDACGMNEHYSATRCVVVPDPPPPKAWFPNAILAGDDRNGLFLPVLRGLMGDLYDLYIYNRMGELIYHTTDQNAGWRPAADTPLGVYTYMLRCRFNTNDIKTYTGTVTLIK